MIKRTFILFYFSFIILTSLQSQTPLRFANLNEQKPSWQSVIGGESVAPIAETSYGFAVVSDGRMISACTYSGSVIWQKSIEGKPNKYLSAWGDFLFVITKDSHISMINPSGVTIWTKNCQFKITENPIIGWDGRIFIKGKNNLACLGTKGSIKWTISCNETENIPLQFFSDGSLLVFLKELKNGKTMGLRISPFGQILEEIVFAGQVITAQSCKEGVLLSFADGAFGLCAINKNSVESIWVHKDINTPKTLDYICSKNDKSILCLQNNFNTDVLLIENKTGSLIQNFTLGQLNLKDIQFLKSTKNGFFICDSKKALEFTSDGTILFEATLPSKNKWNQIFYTEKNQILLCLKNWELNSFVMNQSVQNSKIKIKQPEKNYITSSKTILKIDGITYSIPNQDKIEEIKNTFYTENYSTKEKEMLSMLKEHLENYITELSSVTKIRTKSHSFYSTNPVFTNTLIEAAANSQTIVFAKDFSSLLQLEDDPILLNTLVLNAGKIGYDKDGEILKSFQMLAVNKIHKNDTLLAKHICDSTYEIVKFMGRPALYKQGKTILSNFLYPKYDKEIRDYARETLSNIINLEL